MHKSLNSKYLEVVFVAMGSYYYPKQLIFIWKELLCKEDYQNWKGFPSHFGALGARVLDI